MTGTLLGVKNAGKEIADLSRSDGFLVKDLNRILEEIEGGRYKGTPYLDAEDTNNFTDGVSYSSTTLIKVYNSPMSELPRDRMEKTIQKNMNWFLNNTLESENGKGWSWCGSQEMEDNGLLTSRSRGYKPLYMED